MIDKLASWTAENGMIYSIKMSYDLFKFDNHVMPVDESHKLHHRYIRLNKLLGTMFLRDRSPLTSSLLQNISYQSPGSEKGIRLDSNKDGECSPDNQARVFRVLTQ